MSNAKKKGNDLPFDVFQWSKYIITVLAGLLLLAVAALFLGAKSYMALYKQKEKVPTPIVYQVDEQSKMVVRIEEGDLLHTKRELLRSSTMRQYVLNRETINHLDEADRWGKVKIMSSKSVWTSFANTMSVQKNPDSPMKNPDYIRKIEIITDYPIKGVGNVHRVEFLVSESVKGKEFPPRRFVAVIEFDSSNAQIVYEDRFLNIDGIEVISYDIYKS